MKKIMSILFLLMTLNLVAQDEILSQEYYEGVINNNVEISMYIEIGEDGCPRTYAKAIYKYKNNEKNKWILLKSTFSKQKKQFTFVEFHNTGILLLNKETNSLNGLWISPDGKKQFKVELNKIEVDNKKIEHLEEQLEKEYYYAYDC